MNSYELIWILNDSFGLQWILIIIMNSYKIIRIPKDSNGFQWNLNNYYEFIIFNINS